jgi:thiol-disulfide isomerase/thioredoxin
MKRMLHILGLVLLGWAAAGGQALADETQALIPELRVTTLDGPVFDLSAKRGQWVVVNYWATWCSPCLKEMPDLRAFADSRADVALIGLAYEDISEDEMRAFLVQHPAGYPIAIVDVYAPPADFGAPRGLPMTWLIAPEGHIAKRFLGPVTSRDLAQAIEAAAAP